MVTDESKLDVMLEKMSGHLLASREIEFSDMVLDWYREGLSCEQVLLPKDQDIKGLAVKASIIERMVEVFNNAYLDKCKILQ